MEATPDVYRADIAHTTEHIAQATSRAEQYRRGLGEPGKEAIDYWRLTQYAEDAEAHRAALVRQLENLEHGLARAEALWAQAQAAGAGTRRP